MLQGHDASYPSQRRLRRGKTCSVGNEAARDLYPLGGCIPAPLTVRPASRGPCAKVLYHLLQLRQCFGVHIGAHSQRIIRSNRRGRCAYHQLRRRVGTLGFAELTCNKNWPAITEQNACIFQRGRRWLAKSRVPAQPTADVVGLISYPAIHIFHNHPRPSASASEEKNSC